MKKSRHSGRPSAETGLPANRTGYPARTVGSEKEYAVAEGFVHTVPVNAHWRNTIEGQTE
jgi:hypothetical protein